MVRVQIAIAAPSFDFAYFLLSFTVWRTALIHLQNRSFWLAITSYNWFCFIYDENDIIISPLIPPNIVNVNKVLEFRRDFI